jgi:tRNA nucleotidyltransferase (CCA-adding enzyme)
METTFTGFIIREERLNNNKLITCAIIHLHKGKMPRQISLAKVIEKQLPPELVNFMWLAGEVAFGRGEKLYLVGGVVRDLLLGQPNLDLDLVVEGNAVELALQIKEANGGEITTHLRFGTAKLRWDRWSADFATSRAETYEKPGALPEVTPSPIEKDLSRRDFSINAMAVRLNPGDYGKLVDPCGGRSDLKKKVIRVLHENSFVDDATRIWRALRYEQRLGFRLERETLKLLKRDIDMLDTISRDRIRYELECILREKFPEKVLRRAEELGVLPKLHPALKGNGWLAEKFAQARQLTAPHPPEIGLYLALMTYPLNDEDLESLISRFNLPKSIAQTLRDSLTLKGKLKLVAIPGLSPGSIYNFLEGYSAQALAANSLATDSPTASQNVRFFLSKLRHVEASLSGDDLKQMGVKEGPQMKELLEMLHQARLNGRVTTREGEEELVRGWLAEKGG